MSIGTVREAFNRALPEGYHCTAARMGYLTETRGYFLEFDVMPPDGVLGLSKGEFPPEIAPEVAAWTLAKQIGVGA